MSSHVEKKSSFFVNNTHIPATPFILLGLVLAGIGGITALLVLVKGHSEMYGVTRQVPWGMLISTYAYFVITSTGLAFIGGLGHAFGFESFNKISKRIIVMAVIILIAGFTQILMEIGKPITMIIYMILSPNISAPILWMGIFYGIELGILALEVYLIFKPNPTKADHKLAAIAGFFALLVGTLATSNLGYVFGSLNARAFFHGIYFSTFLVVSGITAGAAMLMLVHNIVYKWNIPSELGGTFKSLAKLMGGGIGMMLFLYLWKIMSSLYTMPGDAYASVMAMLMGPLSVNFWIGEMGLAIAIPLLILVVTKGENMKASGLAGFIFMIGLFFTRFDFVVAGQLPPMRAGLRGSGVHTVDGLATYTASLGEWGVFMLGFGVFFLLYFAAEKFLNLDTEVHH